MALLLCRKKMCTEDKNERMRCRYWSHTTSFALSNNSAKEHHLLMNKHVDLQEEKVNSSLPANKRLQEILDVADE
jgi:hypothetical protein